MANMVSDHAWVNEFVQCHPGNPLCVPVEGNCKVCGRPRSDHTAASSDPSDDRMYGQL